MRKTTPMDPSPSSVISKPPCVFAPPRPGHHRAGARLGAALLCAWVTAPHEARAEVTIANDIDIGVPLGAQTVTRLATGGGVDVRAGYRFRIPYQPIAITPELAAGWAELSMSILRFHPGIRLSVGHIVSAYAYGHVGWGWARPVGAEGRSMSSPGAVASGVSLDGGGGLDVELVPRLTVGAHLGLNVLGIGAMSPSMLPTSLRWVSTGLSASFRF